MLRILLAPLAANIIAQAIKIALQQSKGVRFSWHHVLETGGMPSSHAALVSALPTIIYLEEGMTTAFTVSIILTVIVLRDAFGVRRSVGQEGVALEKLYKLHHLHSRFRYDLGHTAAQVAVGTGIGIAVAIMMASG